MNRILRRYRVLLVVVVLIVLLVLVDRETGTAALRIAGSTVVEMLLVVPPVFLLLGLLDAWVPRQTMVRYMGPKSGAKGIFLAFLIGSAAAGPLYGAFPIASVFMKKGVSFRNVLIFLGAWSTTKIPMFLFELESLGARFACARLAIDIPGIILIACLLEKLVAKREIDEIYRRNEEMIKDM